MYRVSLLLLLSMVSAGSFADGVGASGQLAPLPKVQPNPVSEVEAVADRIVFLREHEVWIATSRGQQLQRLARFEQQFPASPSLSPDGRQVVVSLDEENQPALGRVVVLETSAQGTPRPISFANIHSAHTPAFMPDGNRLVMVTADNYRQQEESGVVDISIAIGAVSGGETALVVVEPKVMLDTGHAFTDPSPSPDGQWLAYQLSGSDVSGGFIIVDARSGQQAFRFPQESEDYRPYWRPKFDPSGTKILCYSLSTDGSAPPQILLVDRQQPSARIVTEGLNPTFTEGGRAIVFERWSQEGEQSLSDLWRLELRPGAQPERIIEDGSQPSGVTLNHPNTVSELEGYFQGLAPLPPLATAGSEVSASEQQPAAAEEDGDGQQPAAVAEANADPCEALWYRRNQIYADKGFCFNTSKAIQAFGKRCFPPYGKLDGEEQRQLREIEAEEVRQGCR